MRTKIKICGITSEEDARSASNLDIDYIGLIFTPLSPRCIDVYTAKKILKIKNNKIVVGVFMNQTEENVKNILKEINLDMLQFHGNEKYDFCRQFDKPFFNSISVEDNNISDYDNNGSNFIIDTSLNDHAGGTGKLFDWSLLYKNIKLSYILKNKNYLVAGGLNVDNIKNLIDKYHPMGLDVSSGLEYNTGKKDINLMRKFVEIVRNHDLSFYDKKEL